MKRLPFILIAMLLVASCKMKEQGTTEAKPDTDIEAVTDTDFCFKTDGKPVSHAAVQRLDGCL